MKMAFMTRPNSWIVQDEAPTTQLTYALKLNPAPLTVSIAGRDPVLGSLEFVITNPTLSPIEVTSITFTIQVGTQSTNLTPSTANTLAASVFAVEGVRFVLWVPTWIVKVMEVTSMGERVGLVITNSSEPRTGSRPAMLT